VEVDVFKSDGTALGYGEVKSGSWQVVFPEYTGQVKFILAVVPSDGSDLMTGSRFLSTTANVTTAGASSISLGAVNIETRNITVNMSGSGGPFFVAVTQSNVTTAEDIWDISWMEKVIVAWEERFTGSKVFPVEKTYTGNLYFLVVNASEMLYVSNAINTGSGDTTVNLNTADMNHIPDYY
jgi:hypothetical protein